jgi:hypothetical protein
MSSTCRSSLESLTIKRGGELRLYRSECPKSCSGATRSRISCLSSFISGKRCSFARDHTMSSPIRTSKIPPVPGCRQTSPISSWNVVSNSCAVHAARRSHRHCVQYSISMLGDLLLISLSLLDGHPRLPRCERQAFKWQANRSDRSSIDHGRERRERCALSLRGLRPWKKQKDEVGLHPLFLCR